MKYKRLTHLNDCTQSNCMPQHLKCVTSIFFSKKIRKSNQNVILKWENNSFCQKTKWENNSMNE
jgi:hypothetical protein